MKRVSYIMFLVGVAIAMVGCSKEDVSYDGDSLPITFTTTKAELSVETKAAEVVTEGETEFGRYSVTACDRVESATRVSSSDFKSGDEIGIYLYYNYYYATNSESVILADRTLIADGVGGCELDGTRRLWTFSSLGGNVPTALLGYGYYPKSATTAMDSSNFTWTHDSTVDLLVASYHIYKSLYENVYSEYSGYSTGEQFKTYITETLGGTIDLDFEHQLATLSFYVYGVGEELTIKNIKVNYTCSEGYDSSTDSKWSETLVYNKESELTVTGGGTLGTSVPETPLTFDNDIFLPPNTVINSIAFSFDGTNYTYTWHPHIENMEVKNYQITFELDPGRNN